MLRRKKEVRKTIKNINDQEKWAPPSSTVDGTFSIIHSC